jgi:hypothetical protein
MRAHTRTAVFRPDARRAALMAGGAAGVALVLAVLLVLRGLGDGITFAAFAAYVVAALLLALAALAGYWALALAGLRYEVGGGALVIVWGLTRQVVPLANTERVVRGRALGPPRVHGLELPRWPCHVGRAEVPRLGEALLYSTHTSPAELLYVVTPYEVYGLSPADPQGFIRALQQGVQAGGGEGLRQEVLRHPLAALPIWTDRMALAVAALGALLALAAVGVVFARYTGLTAQTVLPFPQGERVGAKRELLGIPLTAMVLLTLNAVAALVLHRPLRPLAYTLLFGGAFVQALLLVAALAAT